MYRNKKGEIIGIMVTIIILILLVVLTNTENSNLSYIENIANKLVNPIQNGLTYVKNKSDRLLICKKTIDAERYILPLQIEIHAAV